MEGGARESLYYDSKLESYSQNDLISDKNRSI